MRNVTFIEYWATLFVWTEWNGCVVLATTSALRWNSTGSCVAGQTSGVPGPAANQLQHPYAISFDSNKSLYIVDSENNRIQQWSSGANNCVTVAGLANGTAGTSSYALKNPVGMVLDSAGNLYFTDRDNHRVMYWPKGVSSGTAIAGTNGRIDRLFLEWSEMSVSIAAPCLVLCQQNLKRVIFPIWACPSDP